MVCTAKLTLECLAIGSLPYKRVDEAMDVVRENFKTVPFWPQMTQLDKNEDMIIQFTEGMPSFFADERIFKLNKKANDKFLQDYIDILANHSAEILDYYKISEKYSKAFNKFLELLKETKPEFAKGQVTGAFTFSTSVKDDKANYAFFNNNLREIIVKTMILKALWQIKEIKKANPKTTPIIFIDEPNLSYLGSLKFSDIKELDVIEMIKPVSDIIKQNGGISGLHCCGSCDWAIPIKSGVDMINLNVFMYEKDVDLYIDDLKDFLNNGGKIVWSTVPTMNRELLRLTNVKDMARVFENAVNYLTKKGIDEKIIIENSLITSSCGTGTLTDELAARAMRLVRELSENRKALWHLN